SPFARCRGISKKPYVRRAIVSFIAVVLMRSGVNYHVGTKYRGNDDCSNKIIAMTWCEYRRIRVRTDYSWESTMTFDSAAANALMDITPRPQIVFVRGSGSWREGHEGEKYLEMIQGG